MADTSEREVTREASPQTQFLRITTGLNLTDEEAIDLLERIEGAGLTVVEQQALTPLGQTAELSLDHPHSIEVHRDAKGAYSWTIKRYMASGASRETLDAIRAVDVELQQEYLTKVTVGD